MIWYRTQVRASIVALLLISSGCTPGTPPQTVDAERAQQVSRESRGDSSASASDNEAAEARPVKDGNEKLAAAVPEDARSAGGTPAGRTTADIWLDRLFFTTIRLLTNPDVRDSHQRFCRDIACSELAFHGRVEQALELAKLNSDAKGLRESLYVIAPTQSSAGDVEGALRTAALVEHELLRERTLGLIVIRQAQRGSFPTAHALLDRITDAREKQRALGGIVSAHVKFGAYPEAERMLADISEERERKSLEKEIANARATPRLTDPDYVERSVTRAKQLRAAVRQELDEFEESCLRWRCEAEVALQNANNAAAVDALAKIRAANAESPGRLLRWELTEFAKLCQRAGQRQWAREVCEEMLVQFTMETGNFAQLSRYELLEAGFFGTAIQALTLSEVEQWVRKLQAAELDRKAPTDDVVGGLISGLVMSDGENDAESDGSKRAEQIYKLCTTVNQQFFASFKVLHAMELARIHKRGRG